MTGPAERIGIIAGSGSLPREVAESVLVRGGSVHVVMVDGAAEASLAMFPHTVVNWAQPGRATAALRQAGVRDVVMLGGYQRPNLRTARPDVAFFQMLPAVWRLLRAGGDDAVLRGLVALFERRGLNVVGVADVARDLLIEGGTQTRREPSPQDRADAERGFALVAVLGRYDIGQAAVVANGQIEA
ncbi:MAG TPA: UDP-2,3-diacylglucosamine diphosphatase LpxI, partial [Thermomicrobiales bacterium]|nr:UDP-2,3-diacylglucosamine diphosphatase LpxI [Thermomicrobiales bacterium]